MCSCDRSDVVQTLYDQIVVTAWPDTLFVTPMVFVTSSTGGERRCPTNFAVNKELLVGSQDTNVVYDLVAVTCHQAGLQEKSIASGGSCFHATEIAIARRHSELACATIADPSSSSTGHYVTFAFDRDCFYQFSDRTTEEQRYRHLPSTEAGLVAGWYRLSYGTASRSHPLPRADFCFPNKSSPLRPKRVRSEHRSYHMYMLGPLLQRTVLSIHKEPVL